MEYLEYLNSFDIFKQRQLDKIKAFIKGGHVPSRKTQDYINSGRYVNCFEHALLNLTNEQLKELDVGDSTTKLFGGLANTAKFNVPPTPQSIENNMRALIEKIGLKVDASDGAPLKLTKNQWLIALYFADSKWHFVLQETDGTWSSKEGWTLRVKRFTELNRLFQEGAFATYYKLLELQKLYIITNPYAESE